MDWRLLKKNFILSFEIDAINSLSSRVHSFLGILSKVSILDLMPLSWFSLKFNTHILQILDEDFIFGNHLLSYGIILVQLQLIQVGF